MRSSEFVQASKGFLALDLQRSADVGDVGQEFTTELTPILHRSHTFFFFVALYAIFTLLSTTFKLFPLSTVHLPHNGFDIERAATLVCTHWSNSTSEASDLQFFDKIKSAVHSPRP
jgi:hypothetical protein